MSNSLPQEIVDALRTIVTTAEDLSTRTSPAAVFEDVEKLVDALSALLELAPAPAVLIAKLTPKDAAEARAEVDVLERAKFGGG